MPTPALVALCSEFMEDKATGLVVLFKVVERIKIELMLVPLPLPQKKEWLPHDHPRGEPQGRPTFHGYAAWMRTSAEDSGQEFVHEFRWVAPTGDVYGSEGSTHFFFPDGEKVMRRFTLHLYGPPPIIHSGIAYLESAIRPIQSEDWLIQRYPFIVSTNPPDVTQVKWPGLAEGDRIKSITEVKIITDRGHGQGEDPVTSA